MDNKKKGNIGIEYYNDLYSNAKLETQNPQELCILHKDTIKSFLYEKITSIFNQGKLLGLFGIELTLIITLFTVDFKDFFKISKYLIQSIFVVSSVIIGIFLIICFIKYLLSNKTHSVEKLTDDLIKRGTVIKPDLKHSNNISPDKASNL